MKILNCVPKSRFRNPEGERKKVLEKSEFRRNRIRTLRTSSNLSPPYGVAGYSEFRSEFGRHGQSPRPCKSLSLSLSLLSFPFSPLDRPITNPLAKLVFSGPKGPQDEKPRFPPLPVSEMRISINKNVILFNLCDIYIFFGLLIPSVYCLAPEERLCQLQECYYLVPFTIPMPPRRYPAAAAIGFRCWFWLLRRLLSRFSLWNTEREFPRLELSNCAALFLLTVNVELVFNAFCWVLFLFCYFAGPAWVHSWCSDWYNDRGIYIHT